MDRLQVQWAGTTRTFEGSRVVIGREVDCDVVVNDGRSSRHHVLVQHEAAGWVVVDVSSNGTYVGGRRVTRVPLGPQPVVLNLGDPSGEGVLVTALASTPQPPPQPGRPVASSSGRPLPQPPSPVASRPVAVLPPGQLPHGQSVVLPQHQQAGRSLTIGREPGNDVVLDDPLVSRRHARLDLGSASSPAVIHDLQSFNGVFVNGARVLGSSSLRVGAEVVLGNQTFHWDGQRLVVSATTHEFTLYADGLTQVVDGGKRLIENISFQLAPSSLTAVIGPSGAGKSTLLGALTGLKPASHGRVVWQGHDLYANYDQLRFQIGLVPQQDILHPQLKVRQGLGYAARLRLPPDTSAPEREQRVQQVAHQLQLTERLENRIGTQLSGGQRKRVSIATELLTAPPLLFLDEPTSGLDPGLDLEVMKQLRSLADDGRVVMVVTHSVLALDICDNIIVLAPGGRIAYFGPPSGVLAHFGKANYPEVFDLLDTPDLWSRIPAPRHAVDTSSMRPVGPVGVPMPPRQSVGRQLATLVSRNLAVVMADRLLLGMLVLLPLILGGLSRLVPGSNGLSLDRTLSCPPGTTAMSGQRCRQAGGQVVHASLYLVTESTQRLTVLIVAACLMGTAIAIRELVGERPIFKREYAVGLSPGVYYTSKVLVLGLAAFVQGLIVTFIATVGLPGADGRAGTIRVAVAIAALALTMALVGLALSALVTSNEQTMPALVGVIMVELVLSGALFAIAGRPVLEQVAWLSPSRWAYAASASAMGLVRGQTDRDTRDWIALSGGGHYALDLGILGLLALLVLIVGMLLVRRSATSDD
ncbi:MAG: ATP-binding cassette domain-containing protein [Nocardioidaceae bacterium]|nr:ATP-binding cassette domain-containing protein [Nocardioidaceae bacterium]